MSSGATSYGIIPPTDNQYFAYDREDKPPPYTQEPICEGCCIEAEEDLAFSRRNLNPKDCSGSIESGFRNPAYQNPPENPHLEHCPPYFQQPQPQPQYQPSSQHDAPYQPGFGSYGPSTNYIGQNYSTLRCGPSAPQGFHGIGQQPTYPAPIANDRLPPEARRNCVVVTQPQVYYAQPAFIIAQPIFTDPPNDYFCFSIFVTVCCCWILGIRAIIRSAECRSAIAVGDRQLANEKSIAARKAACAALVCGFVAYIITGASVGTRFAKLLST